MKYRLLSVLVWALSVSFPVAGQAVDPDDSPLETRAASMGLTYPLTITGVTVSTNTGSAVIETTSASGLPAKIGFDGSPSSKERWTFILAGERVAKGSHEEATVVGLLAAWVCTNVPPDIAGAVAKGRYTDAQELILLEMVPEDTNPFCLRILDVLANAARIPKKQRSPTPPPQSGSESPATE